MHAAWLSTALNQALRLRLWPICQYREFLVVPYERPTIIKEHINVSFGDFFKLARKVRVLIVETFHSHLLQPLHLVIAARDTHYPCPFQLGNLADHRASGTRGPRNHDKIALFDFANVKQAKIGGQTGQT